MTRMHNPPHPGKVLREYLGSTSVTKAAANLGVHRVTLSRVLTCSSGISADMAYQLRAARVRNNVSQAALAKQAGVAVTALRRLELGQGATVSTLVSVVRVLGRQTWLDSLQPAVTISPLQMLKSTRQRQRAGSPHKSKPTVA